MTMNLRMANKTIFVSLFLIVLTGIQAMASIVKLQTEFMDRPLGIDVSQPRFSWQMKSDRYGMTQTAYQILVAFSEEYLAQERYVYDSGKIESENSINIKYCGDALRPASRYFWKVRVWDEKNQLNESAIEWFETGLFGTSWQQAQWIGSSEVNLAKCRSHFVLEYDFSIEKGSNEATFVLGGKSDSQYVSLTVDTKDTPQLIIAHVMDNKRTVDFAEDISSVFSSADKHRVKIKISGPHAYTMHIDIDGQLIKNNKRSVAGNQMMMFGSLGEYAFSVRNDSPEEPNSNSRLYQIGFAQTEGQHATFSNIRISEEAWNTELYTDNTIHAVKGNGKPQLWQPGEEVSAPMFRKRLKIEKPIRQARLYATARGVYEFHINGEKVGTDYLNPGWTDFRKRIMYNTIDITSMLKQGDNGVGAMLGIGWFGDHMGFNANWQDQYGVRPSMMAMIAIEYTDGKKEYIVTDNSWKCYNQGPILANSLFNGEDYDARKELPGWTNGSYNDTAWEQVEIFEAPAETVILQGYVGLTIQNNVTLKAISVKKVGDKNFVYDMGQNLAGVPRLVNMKGKAGQTITIHFAEMLYPEIIPTDPVVPYTVEIYKEKKGQLYKENYRSALSTDHYIFKGNAAGETFEPRFTYHGFRYLSVEGLDEPLPLENVQAIALESIGEQTSFFETSNADINRLFENAVWGQRGNFLAVPTDCPQRDERMGWTGDAQVFARAATYNMNLSPFYTRWLYSIRDNQAATGSYGGYYPDLGIPPAGASRTGSVATGGWMEAGVIVPWQMYQQYGDRGILEEHYSSMLKFMDFMERNATNYIQPFGGTGDWLAPIFTNTMLTNTAYSAYAAQLMGQIALALDKEDDGFARFFANIKKVFNDTFVNTEGRTVVPASSVSRNNPMSPFAAPSIQSEEKKDAQGNMIVDTQTSYVLPLQFGLFNDENKPKAVQHLREAIKRSNYTLTTGFVGTPYICLVLSDNGYPDEAYKLFTQTEYPSWLFPVKQGATTFWERWNSYTVKNGFGTVSMNSFNHYAYGAIEEWMMAHCLGIQRNEARPGYKHFFLQPEVGEQLDFAKGGFETMHGKVESGWKKRGNTIVYQMTIPANTTATIKLLNARNVKVETGQVGIISQNRESDTQYYEVSSGRYIFEVN
jgi:alpha-L-rhamnosidase